MECVFIEWEDAVAVDDHLGWHDVSEIKPAQACMFRHVGFVVDCDPWAITLTEAHGGLGQIAPRTRIPLGMIRRFVRIDPDGMSREEEA